MSDHAESPLTPATLTMSPTTRDMSHTRVALSLASRTNLLNRMVIVWQRGKAKVNRWLRNMSPKTHAAHESACRLPYEVVELIIGYLIHDLDTLKACSLTCRSWYLAVVPHIRHTLILGEKRYEKPCDNLIPLSKVQELGLMPLMKKITVLQSVDYHWFTPQAFSPRDLRYFSAFTTIRTLRIRCLEIYRFIPGIERYFEQFSPTLRSITLWDPCCTPRQLSYFLSLFSNLDNVGIRGISTRLPETTIPDTELVQFSAPKLRGELVLSGPYWAETWTHLITSCGGLRFNYLNLYGVGGIAPILFEACAKTVETLRFSPADASVRFRSLSSPGFDLSRLQVLQSLHVTGWATNLVLASARHTILMDIFSTITSPVFSELVIVLGGGAIARLPSDAALFETLCAMNKVRPFKLVFSLAVPDRPQGGTRRKLEKAIDSVTAKGFLDFLDSPPAIYPAGLSDLQWETRR